MRRRYLVSAIVLAAAFAAAGTLASCVDSIVDSGPPPPGNYVAAKWKTADDRPNCGFQRPPEIAAQLQNDFQLFELGAGSDTVAMNLPITLTVFDSESPQTLLDHDMLLLTGPPGAFTYDRIGPHLLICRPSNFMSLLLARHYCHGVDDKMPWNNEIEEITFPWVRETWLNDSIYDAMPKDGSFPSLERVRDKYKLGEYAGAAQKEWTVKPFRDVLPSAWASSIDCRND